MEGEDAIILGVVRPEESYQAEVDRDAMIIDKPQKNPDEIVVVNRALEFDGDMMVLDDVSPETKSVPGSAVGFKKEANCNNAIVPDCIVSESLNLPDMKVGELPGDSSSIKSSIKCQPIAIDEQKGAKKQLKRKRLSVGGNLNHENKESLKAECRQELDELFEYYKEVSGVNLQIDGGICCSNNSMVAILLEERNLPFSKLVEEIYNNLKGQEGVTLASVRGSVLLVGQRILYGISSADADVLEDDTESCLWCWETRDLKLLPATFRGMVNIRRVARKKIYERISALSETLSLLSISEQSDNYQSDLLKASKKLGKVLDKQAICSLVEKMKQKNCADMAEKEAKLKEKELLKEIEKSKRSAEKEKQKMDRELQKEKLQNEKEMKRMKEEAEREEKRREKEEAELKRQLKKQQEEAAKEQRRREKEEAELKKQRAVQKQASIMDRFLNSKKSSNDSDNSEKRSTMKVPLPEASSKMEEIVNSATSSMDSEFSQQYDLAIEDLHRLHIAGWRKLAHCNRSSHWGVRRNPKTELIKEIKLQRSSVKPEQVGIPDKKSGSESCYERLADELEESFPNSMACQNELVLASAPCRLWHRKLLQFDKSNRPAYYGTWSKKSGVVGPRHPFKKDPELDYDADSDEEWEEEEPGESLSDCDKDNEESLDEESLKNQDDDESEDSFVVPDGYLSDNEGVEIEASSKLREDEVRSLLSGKSEEYGEEFRALLQQQKFLHNLTEKALRKNQPLVIANLNHEKDGLITAEDLIGTDKIEQICMQALCMRICPGGSIIDISTHSDPLYEEHETCQATRESSKRTTTAAVIADSDLPEFVKLIQSCPHGINKVVEVLQQTFPTIAKSQLRNKVRETSDFVDNHWQVKKDVLEKLGLPVTPDKNSTPKGIAMFFSKRCLPPEGESGVSESSPEQCSKSRSPEDQIDSQSTENAL